MKWNNRFSMTQQLRVSTFFFSLDVLAGEIAKIFVFSSDKKLTHCWLGQAVLFARDRFPSQREKNL